MVIETFGDLGTLFDGPHATPTRTNNGPYFLNISSLKSGRLDLAESDHVSASDFKRWTRRVTPRDGDLLFSYETRLGDAALMPPGVEACLGRRMALLRPNFDRVDPRYLLYFFLSPSFQGTIEQHAVHGATVSRIGLASMPGWPVDVHPLAEQRAIAQVLGALDDKIAANDRVVLRSTELGTALFGRAIEEGAEVVTLASVARHCAGKYLAKSEYGDVGKYYVYGSNSVMGKCNTPLFEGSFSVLAKIGSYCGSLRWSERPAWVNNNASAIMPERGVDPWVLRHALEKVDMLPHRSGSGQPYIRIPSLMSAPVQWPAPRACAHIGPMLRVLAAREAAAAEENESLMRTRDELLPLLMSGQLRIKDVGELVEGML